MALPDQLYHELLFELVYADSSGHRDDKAYILCRQEMPDEIEAECGRRGVDPFTLRAQWDRSEKYSSTNVVGTRFLLKAKLNDKEGGGMFFTSHYTWAPIKIIQPSD